MELAALSRAENANVNPQSTSRPVGARASKFLPESFRRFSCSVSQFLAAGDSRDCRDCRHQHQAVARGWLARRRKRQGVAPASSAGSIHFGRGVAAKNTIVPPRRGAAAPREAPLSAGDDDHVQMVGVGGGVGSQDTFRCLNDSTAVAAQQVGLHNGDNDDPTPVRDLELGAAEASSVAGNITTLRLALVESDRKRETLHKALLYVCEELSQLRERVKTLEAKEERTSATEEEPQG